MLIFNYILFLKNEISVFIYKNMRLLRFSEFILESSSVNLTVPFVMSPDFSSFLKEIDSPISVSLAEYLFEPSDVSLVTFGSTYDTIKFTTAPKIAEILKSTDVAQLNTLVRPLIRQEVDIYHKSPVDIRVGRFVRKLFQNKFTDVQIEDFVNKYKSLTQNRELSFNLLDDLEIIEGYKSINFTFENGSTNSLMNSCMNDELKLVNFYRYLPVRLLVLSNSQQHIFGRALIWKTNLGYFMDRVYVAYDSDYHKFVKWANDRGVIYKAENKSGPKIEYIKDGKRSWFELTVDLDFNVEGYDEGFPYMDTFIHGQKNILTNAEPSGNFYVFQDTDGDFFEVIEKYDIKGNRISMDELGDYIYSETQQGYIHHLDCKYVDVVQDFLSFDYLDDPKNGFVFDPDKKNYIKVSK
jgi:hypothetical protein